MLPRGYIDKCYNPKTLRHNLGRLVSMPTTPCTYYTNILYIHDCVFGVSPCAAELMLHLLTTCTQDPYFPLRRAPLQIFQIRWKSIASTLNLHSPGDNTSTSKSIRSIGKHYVNVQFALLWTQVWHLQTYQTPLKATLAAPNLSIQWPTRSKH